MSKSLIKKTDSSVNTPININKALRLRIVKSAYFAAKLCIFSLLNNEMNKVGFFINGIASVSIKKARIVQAFSGLNQEHL
ncbi:hypothetical protein MNB_SUP05-SYMBIONT-4-96 [hydrothermal vent metagenome]|uniref:Uncharacterized protein n=1 Tax=hydrothermal vent metagenome TaxID=652676 RepID=A0A1W1DXR8_9ZZZZ